MIFWRPEDAFRAVVRKVSSSTETPRRLSDGERTKMNELRIKTAVTGSLLGTLLFAGLAVAGEGAPPSGAEAQAQREALVSHFFARMDANKDDQVTRLEAELVSKSLFAKLDRNENGEITPAEAESGMRALRKEELAAHFKTLDASRDGRLTIEEAKLPAAFFGRLDKDKDSSLTSDEFQAMPEMPGARQQFEFERADLNHDGKVTRDEGGRSARERFASVDTNKDSVITRAELDARLDAMLKAGAQGRAQAAPPRR
jgi:Ca2+-binding EF-hand superfamily protein